MKIARDVETEMRGSLLPRVSAGGARNWKGNGSGGYGLSWKTGSGSQHNPGSTRVGNGSTNYSAGSVQSKTGSSPSNPNGNTNANTSTVRPRGDGGRRYGGERNRGLKHLPYSELMERRAQGLCFRCGEKYHPLHQCAEKQLRLVILGDDETINEEGEVIAIEVKEDEEEVLDCNSMGLFGITETNIKSNNTPPTTLRLQGSLKGVSIMILIDSGASHNFVSPHVATALGLNVEQGRSMGVKLGDGHRVSTRGRCRKLEVCLNDFTTSVDAYVLELGDLDMTLGVAWLQRFGKVTFDWEKMTVSFLWEGKRVELHGQFFTTKEVSTNNISHAPMDSLHSLLEEEVVPTNEVQELTEVQKQELNELLSKFKGVFEENTGLPPKREINHAIELQKDAGPVSVRPYRYPHHYKEEIEKQVRSMLSQVPDRYPIPVVDELLDELHGTECFSKLDLKSGYHQIRVKEEDVQKTTFQTHEGHYEFLVMPFGLTNAPATFQSTMNQIFKPYLRKFVLVFFDDILVYSKGWKEHLAHLSQVLEILQHHCFVVNQKKCNFASRKVEYLGHGITGNGKIAKPLTELTKKEGFHWGPEELKAFENLKRVMIQAPVLTLPDFAQPFEIECDASGRGIGAVLMQKKKPIAYFSKALSKNNLSKSAYEKELMALVLAVQHWRPYLLGRKFVVYSDQKSLRHLLQQRITTADQQNWIAKLLGYHFEEQQIQHEVRNDPYLKKVMADLHEFHSSSTGDHSGFLRTYRRLAGNLYWVGMRKSVQTFVQSCDVCQRQKYSASSPMGLLQPLPIPESLGGHLNGFHNWSSEITGHPYTARKVAEIFTKEVVRLHGVPQSIVSDRDPLFVSLFWKELFRFQGTMLSMSSSYHPKTDGQTEVVNRCLEAYLRCFASEQPKEWSQWIPWAELWYNTTFHVSTGTTPFEAVYGRKPPTVVRFLQGETKVEAMAAELVDRDEALRQLKYHLTRAQE
ncbi:uncharacterized protein LOC127130982 [Lathyrus oleraceus]|nr:uncharacterized protein LOC127130982 [Pisum sativum]